MFILNNGSSLSRFFTFSIAAKHESFTKAAAELQVTKSSNFSQCKKVRRGELGFLLFDRTRRVVVLTPAGQALYDSVNVMLNQLENNIQNIQLFSKEQEFKAVS